jgi:lipoate-protein ligase A
MHGVATEKVPGGKLLRVKVDFDEKISDVKITGDFFLHPEEGVSDLERCMVGLSREESESRIAERISKVVEQKKLQLIGIDAASIARVTKAAMR